MNVFLSGLSSVLVVFIFSLVISFLIVTFAPRKKPKRPPAKKEAVYYVAAEEPVKKVRPIAIKGTVLSKSQLDELMKK